MTAAPGEPPILTLEPLIETVRGAVESEGWSLSGLQKTTSHQFEGRWEGEATRSAYAFFHRANGPEWVSVDVYLDETSRGLRGNIALVLDLLPLRELGDVPEVLQRVARASALALPEKLRRPVTLRLRMDDAAAEVSESEVELRLKVRLPATGLKAGVTATTAQIREIMDSFAALLRVQELIDLVDLVEE